MKLNDMNIKTIKVEITLDGDVPNEAIPKLLIRLNTLLNEWPKNAKGVLRALPANEAPGYIDIGSKDNGK